MIVLGSLVLIALSTIVIDLATDNAVYNNYVIKQICACGCKAEQGPYFRLDEFGPRYFHADDLGVRYSLFMGTIAIALSLSREVARSDRRILWEGD